MGNYSTIKSSVSSGLTVILIGSSTPVNQYDIEVAFIQQCIFKVDHPIIITIARF